MGPKQVDYYWRFAINAGTMRTQIILYQELQFYQNILELLLMNVLLENVTVIS